VVARAILSSGQVLASAFDLRFANRSTVRTSSESAAVSAQFGEALLGQLQRPSFAAGTAVTPHWSRPPNGPLTGYPEAKGLEGGAYQFEKAPLLLAEGSFRFAAPTTSSGKRPNHPGIAYLETCECWSFRPRQ